MKNKSIFAEKFLVWKEKIDVPTTSSDTLEKARAQYFNLREYLRSNYEKLNITITDKIAKDPNEYLYTVKKRLDQVAFDDKFDPRTISIEDLKSVRKSVLSGDLEFFYTELASLTRGMFSDEINDSLIKKEF